MCLFYLQIAGWVWSPNLERRNVNYKRAKMLNESNKGILLDEGISADEYRESYFKHFVAKSHLCVVVKSFRRSDLDPKIGEYFEAERF